MEPQVITGTADARGSKRGLASLTSDGKVLEVTDHAGRRR